MTIGQVAAITNIPISTLRYYDKEGLLPNLKRSQGVRNFDEESITSLKVIECLKKSGLQINDIRQFMAWCQEGSTTYTKRLNLFKKQYQEIKRQIQKLKKTKAMLDFKVWYYTKALKTGTEENLKQMLHEHTLPPEMQEKYDFANN